jgi:hypothetical protein
MVKKLDEKVKLLYQWPMRQLDPGIWVIDHSLSMGGLQLGTRTTVLGLSGGGTLVHAPGPLTEEQRAAVTALGPVRAIVLPNLFHHRFAAAATSAWPDARVLAAAGLRAKRKDLRIDEDLGPTPPAAWGADVALVPIDGVPKAEETVLLHRPSRTLVVADLVFHIRESRSWLTRVAMRLNGVYGKFAPTKVFRRMVRDPAALRRSIDRLLEQDFDRVVLAHGDVLDTGGRAALAESFAWLGRA